MPDFGVSENTFTVQAGQTKDITVTFQPQTEGTLTGTLDLLSNDPTNGTLSVTLTGVSIVVPADPRADSDGNGSIEFADFLSFAKAFGSADAAFDIDDSGTVDFGDFLVFAKNFGKSINSSLSRRAACPTTSSTPHGFKRWP